MAATKQYANAPVYERKLARVMERFGIGENAYDWDYSRKSAWVQFTYKGQLYRFEHSVENAQAHGQTISYGSDAFAQIVLALEDLARLANRGIYDLQTWVAGMKALPPKSARPDFCEVLGLEQEPETMEEVEKAYMAMAKSCHPDGGGSTEAFCRLSKARDDAINYLQTKGKL